MNCKFINGLFGLFIFCCLLGSCNSNVSTLDITLKRFEKLMADGDVKAVTLVINKRIVEITLTEGALNKQRIANELNIKSPSSANDGPHCKIVIFSPESFKEDFETINPTWLISC